MKEIKVTCAVILKEGLFLAVQRSRIMSMPLKWEFPGGKVEEGESLESSLIREIAEELALNISLKEKLAPVVHEYREIKVHLFPYLAEITSGQLILLEHHAHRWLMAKELLLLDWAEADLPVAKAISQRFG